MKSELHPPEERPSRLAAMLNIGWMLFVLACFVLIRVVGSQTFQSLHLPGKVR